ncbi:MAG: 5-formyltetrahydrofolate cyclo-ligase [Actinobacteria bacterium]|nr:MAG: 5-formyltetrahydrofolate cyclo-ligase [Actinomycetota bacterium]
MRASELKRAKRDVRRAVLAARDAIGEAERVARSTEIHRRFLALREAEGVGVVMGFWSFGSEVSTPPLLETMHARGVRVCLPRIGEGDLEAVAYEPGDPMNETSFGVREPADGTILAPEALDLVMTPGVAFDRSGHRIGYGGGFYDRFLRRTRRGVPRVAIAFDLQVQSKELPAGSFDLGVDVIVTETETIRCAPGGTELGVATSQT